MESELVPPVRIEDDGELAEVRRVLDALEIPYAEAADPSPAQPALLISSLRHAVAKRAGGGAGGRFHIVVAEKLSRTMQQELRRLQPDFLLERPVDPIGLRLLILHALYGGPERRRSERAAMCAVVGYRTGLLTRKATLVDLSQSGCRLVSSRPLEPGEQLKIRLPRELTGLRGLTLEGRVVAADGAPELEAGAHAASVAFAPLDAPTRELIRSVMAEHAVGSGPLRPHPPGPRETSQPLRSPQRGQDPGPAPASSGERRAAARAVFERSVLAAGRGGAHVLIGRDLSSGGMRVAPDPSLALGDAFNLVIHGPGQRRPTVVRAVAARNDGDAGWVLRFEGASAALAEIVASLPSLPGAAEDASGQPHVVVSEVIGTD